MSASPARMAALEVVARVRERDAFAHETLDAVLRRTRLDQRDAALATRLAYGTISARGTLDEAIARVADDGTTLEPRVGDALAIGAYEILFADTPRHAAVSETVELVRSERPQASGLANALMRRLSAAAEEFPWGDPERDIEALARLHAHPHWLASLWVDELGRDAAAQVMAADNLPAPLYLAHLGSASRAKTVTDSLVEIGATPSPGPVPGSLVVGSAANARKSEALQAGEVVVMDAAAQLAAQIMRPRDGDTIVEIGAGRGGKSLLMAAFARASGGRARVLAVDLHDFKLRGLRAAAEKIGFDEIALVCGDATRPDFDPGVPDGSAGAVLVDAPCSGLGTLRRHPDRRWRARPEEIRALAELGSQLLTRAARLVKPGGFVVYSTCTIARQENAEVIDGFLASAQGDGFSVEDLGDEVPAAWRRFVPDDGWFQSLPEPNGPDGHFVARLRRV